MIFDWKANAVKVLCEGKYSDGDKWERKKEYLQQLTLCAYLSSLGWDKSRIFEKWRSIPTEERKRDAIAEDELEGRFRLIYGRAMEKKYSHTLTLDYGKEHVLYREEIDAINSLNSTYVFRKYLFNLLCIDMRHGMLYSYRQIDDRFSVSCRFPYIQNCVADFQCVFWLGSGEAFRTVLKTIIGSGFLGQLL